MVQEPEAIEDTTPDVPGAVPPEPTAIEGSEPSEIEATAAIEPDETDETPKPDKSSLQKRFDKMAKARREADREAAYQRGRAETLEAAKKVEPTEPAIPVKPKPAEGDFEAYDDYIDALTDWKVDQKLVEFDEKVQVRADQDRASEGRTAFQEKLSKGTERYEDFEEVAMNLAVPITQGIVDVLQGCEDPVGIAYYLGKNLKEATMISRMPPLQAARAIGKIETEVAAAEKASPPKPVTKAPEPIKPVSGAEVSGKDPDNMSYEEYKAYRASGGGK